MQETVKLRRKSDGPETNRYQIFTKEKAAPLLKSGQYVLYSPPEKKTAVPKSNDPAPTNVRATSILAAIPKLDPDVDWTKGSAQKSSRPSVDALSRVTGFEVTAEERDAAFEAFSKGQE